MTASRKSKCNEIYQLIQNSLLSKGIRISINKHFELIQTYCELKQVIAPIHFTPESLKQLLSSTNSPIPISSGLLTVNSKASIKKKRSTKKKVREAILVTSDMSKEQVAKLYQADLIAFATKPERTIKSLLRKAEIKFEFQKTWIETRGKEFHISDFFIPSLALTLEIDGKSHNAEAQKQKDSRKESYLLSLGIKTLRITNKQANRIDAVFLHKFLVKNA